MKILDAIFGKHKKPAISEPAPSQGNNAEALKNLGNAQYAQGNFLQAIDYYRAAISSDPGYAQAHSNLGLTLEHLGQFDAALDCFHQALQIDPNLFQAHNNLGHVLDFLGEFDSAFKSYRRALEIRPDFYDAHSNLIFIQNYLPDKSAEDMLAEARAFGQKAAANARPSRSWQGNSNPDRRLRIGFVSGDLHEHPVGYFIESVLAELAHSPLDLFAYPTVATEDALTRRIRPFLAAWKPIAGLSDEQSALVIHGDAIDILIDLAGHTAHNRLPMFAWKPAPLQVSWLGYFATTGIAEIDYLIADPWTLPPDQERFFTEKILRMPETRLCFTAPKENIPVAPLPALTNHRITFGCFNNLAKVNDTVIALWARVLAAVPDSRLLLKAWQFSEARLRQKMLDRFAAHAVATERLILEPPGTRAEYLAAYGNVDMALDPFPFPGGTTTVEALWMGVPVLTLTGEHMISRQGVSILKNAGMDEWIARDADDYVTLAHAHAADIERLATLRAGLRQQLLTSPLFDAKRFAAHFESLLRKAWIERVKNLPAVETRRGVNQERSANSQSTSDESASIKRRIIYFCPDFSFPSGGIKVLYRHVHQLRQRGLDAYIMHSATGFCLTWHGYIVPTLSLENRTPLHTTDILVFPEGLIDLVKQSGQFGATRVLIPLNWAYIYESLPSSEDWRDYGISHVITPSPVIKEFVEWSMGIDVQLIPEYIDAKKFHANGRTKKNKIAYMPRKSPVGDTLEHILKRKSGLAASYEWVRLLDLTEMEYAERLGESRIYLTPSAQEGANISVLEAMASGCLVIGFTGVGGKAFMIGEGDMQNCILVENDDLLGLGKALEQAVERFAKNSNAYDTILENALLCASRFQDEKPEAESLYQYFSALMLEG